MAVRSDFVASMSFFTPPLPSTTRLRRRFIHGWAVTFQRRRHQPRSAAPRTLASQRVRRCFVHGGSLALHDHSLGLLTCIHMPRGRVGFFRMLGPIFAFPRFFCPPSNFIVLCAPPSGRFPGTTLAPGPHRLPLSGVHGPFWSQTGPPGCGSRTVTLVTLTSLVILPLSPPPPSPPTSPRPPRWPPWPPSPLPCLRPSTPSLRHRLPPGSSPRRPSPSQRSTQEPTRPPGRHRRSPPLTGRRRPRLRPLLIRHPWLGGAEPFHFCRIS